MDASAVATAVLLVIGTGGVPLKIEVLETSSCDQVLGREREQSARIVSDHRIREEYRHTRLERSMFGREVSSLYICRENQVVSQMVVSKLPNTSEARHHWHTIRDALRVPLGAPCREVGPQDLDSLEALSPGVFGPDEAYWASWRVGETRIRVSIQGPSGTSTDWAVIVRSAPRNPGYRVAPDGTKTEMPEPECDSRHEVGRAPSRSAPRLVDELDALLLPQNGYSLEGGPRASTTRLDSGPPACMGARC